MRRSTTWFQRSPSINKHIIHRLMTEVNCYISPLSHLQYPPWFCLLQPLPINLLHSCKTIHHALPRSDSLSPHTKECLSSLLQSDFGTAFLTLLMPTSRPFFLQPYHLIESFPNRTKAYYHPSLLTAS